MLVRDAIGNTLNEGDPVAFPLGMGQSVMGTIVKIDSGLGHIGTAPRQATVFVSVVFPLAADPAGVVGGIIKTATPGPALDS